jgi:hypothetical protein
MTENDAKPKITKKLAARVAQQLPDNAEFETAREIVDEATGGDLDCTQLDLLTEWAIKARTESAA